MVVASMNQDIHATWCARHACSGMVDNGWLICYADDPYGASAMNTSQGTYVLLIKLSRRRRIRIGKLGMREFPPGFYAYVGSAMGGLKARIARHFRSIRRKRPHWHIDYFLAAGVAQAVYARTGPKRRECLAARTLGEELPGISGFGCSDCRCRSHLFYSPHAELLITRLENDPLGFIRHDPNDWQ